VQKGCRCKVRDPEIKLELQEERRPERQQLKEDFHWEVGH